MQVDSDSSEEDEDISSSVPVKNERKSFPVKKAAKAILISTVEDEEEYDEPLPAPVEEPAAVADVVAKKTAATAAVPAAICSTECSEALAALSLDNWDVSSWMVLLEEVEQGRGGSMSVIDAYNKILKQFPRAARFWKRLAEHLLKKKDSDSLETLFDEAAERCRSVELWLLYLQFIRSTLVDASLNQSEEYFANRRTTELAYERAIDNVGRAIDSYPIWRKYLDTVRSWTDAGKVAAMRKIYQRAVCVPMDNMEEIWNEYEAFEKQYSDAMAEQVLSEFQKKHLHAKSIYRDRKKLADPIIFDRLATPPLNNSAEIRQLHVWNSWLKFEQENPDNLATADFQAMMQMIYEQFLCCFRHHTEAWMSYINFVCSFSGDVNYRELYKEAMSANPTTALLRVAAAEKEELMGDIEAAKGILSQAYEEIPSGFTFSILQRLVRRTEGVKAARKLFSDSYPTRLKSPKLGIEIFLAHAKLELEVNHEPRTSYKVLQLAAATYPGAFRSLDFVKVLTNILTILGDLHQLRWLFQSVLNIEPSTASNSKASESTLESVIKTKYFNAKEELDLWEEFLHAETVLGLSCTARLNELRKKRDRARKDYEDSERFKFDAIIASRSESKTLSFGIFEASADMIERYELLTVLEDGYITTTDNDFRSRIHTCVSDIRSSDSRLNRILSNNTGNSSKATINMSADFHLSLAGLPVVLRNLLSKLPFHSGPSPDYDGFIRHVKNIILPPRPEEVADEAVGLNSKLNDESLLENNLMQAEWLRQLEGNNDIYLDGGFQEVSDHKSISGNSGKSKLEVEDIFRKRQRIKRTVHNA